MYSPCLGSSRERLWEELRALKGLWGRPRCVGGDFNVLRFPHEHSRERRLSQAMRRSSQVIDDMDLKDLPTKGGHFNLSGGLNGQRTARLDLFLINDEWDNFLSNVIQIVLPKLISDHFLISLEGVSVWLRAHPHSVLSTCG